MKMEDHFKETLNRAVANEPPVLDAWDRFEQRAGRGRRVRLLAAIAAAAAVAIASVIVVPKLGSNNAIQFPPATQPPTTQPPSPTPTPSVDPYAGWKTYTNTDQHYRVKYPADWMHTMFEAVHEFVPPGLRATDATGPEGSFGVIINLHRVGDIEAPNPTSGTRSDGRAEEVDFSDEGTVIVITHRIDWSATRCNTLRTACAKGDDLVLTVRINGEDSSEFMGKYREFGDKIAASVVYVP